MAGKKYSLVYHADKGGAFIKDNDTGIEWYHDSRGSLLDIVNKLNEQHEENEFLKVKNERTQISIRQKDKQITDLIIKKEDTEYELLHLKEKYEELLKENQELKIIIEQEEFAKEEGFQ